MQPQAKLLLPRARAASNPSSLPPPSFDSAGPQCPLNRLKWPMTWFQNDNRSPTWLRLKTVLHCEEAERRTRQKRI